MDFPGGKKFAFTIFDDTDRATVENVKPVYDMLFDLGIFTTKSVWVFSSKNTQSLDWGSQTLEDIGYLEFIRSLSKKGVEIAFHNASMDSSKRETTITALEQFYKFLGFYPNVHTNHKSNKENLYWGQDRLDLWLLKFVMKCKRKSSDFVGHKLASPFFWGDICQNYITYVRNFVFREINLLRINPTLPYKDPNRSFVNYWFSSSEGGSVRSFNQLLSSKNQSKLERNGGVCIVYTHFANDFVENGNVNPKTKELLSELSKRDGWFVPVSTLLDYLRSKQVSETRSFNERVNMELRWFLNKLFYGTS
ncbi:hypothetical protein ACFLWI_05590 [Chloroflexota bacterium]